jgi:O-acetyl-ADP-ribose deacetylase (regulator of RNase III)
MPLEIVRNDITKMEVDTIVNAANSQLQRGSGVCGAIFEAAGAELLQFECDTLAPCPVGQAVITLGYHLPANYIIHTVGPVWQGGEQGEEALLASCYTSSLSLAKERGINSIAFPLISSGIYGYPKELALQIAMKTIGNFLQEHEMQVTLVVYDPDSYQISRSQYHGLRMFIDDNYVEEHLQRRRRRNNADLSVLEETNYEMSYRSALPSPKQKSANAAPTHTYITNFPLSETFSEMLLRHIDRSGLTDPQVYRRANIDRRLFSKIRSNPDYQPSKNTALALAIALKLNLDQTTDLLRRAGYALSPSSKFDLTVEYFIRERMFDITEINFVLYTNGHSMLGV